MKCVVCHRKGGFHRAVVDTTGEEVLGSLCRECEREEFGRSIDRGLFQPGDGCIFCERDGTVAIPLWRPDTRTTAGGTVVNEVSIEVDDATLRLCDEHLAAVAGEYPGSEARRPAATHR